jgi:hypothetical protein
MVTEYTATEKVISLSDGLEIWRVQLDDLYEQDKNARTMSPETFDRMVANIKGRGELESLPLVHLAPDEKFYIISGHHRARAARSAELKVIPVLVDTSGLNHSQVVSKQLAHNSIQGVDDRQLLSQLYQEMKTVEDMLASHLDPKMLDLADSFKGIKIEDLRVDFTGRTVVFAFLPSEEERFKELAERIPKDVDLVGTSTEEFHKTFISTLNRVGVECEIRNVGAMVSKMTDLVAEWLGEEIEDETAVPLGALFGRTTVPPVTAKIIEEAIEKTVGDGTPDKEKWLALEQWAHNVVNQG